MSHHDNTSAWAAIILAAIFHIMIAVAAIHALTTGHASPAAAIIVGAPSIVALTAASLSKAAARPMPGHTR
jgi:hypothetical protein